MVDGFGSRRQAVLARGRARAEALFDASCRITRLSTERGPMDAETLKYEPADTTTIYDGPCKIQGGEDDRPETAGERPQRLGRRKLHLPVTDTGTVAVGDVIEILTNEPDPSLIGRIYTVTGRHDETHATARRLPITEVSG